MRKRLTPWQKIARAAERGTGTYLTPQDCWRLGHDNAIITRAELDDDPAYEDEDAIDRTGLTTASQDKR
jgi:hypothetical protein